MNQETYDEYLRRQHELAPRICKEELIKTTGVFTSKRHMYMTDGKPGDAMVLADILYWASVDQDGNSRMKYKRDGHLWSVRTHEEISKRTGLSVRKIRRALKRLEDNNLIVRELLRSPFHRQDREDGKHSLSKVTHLRPDWQGICDKICQMEAEATSVPFKGKNVPTDQTGQPMKRLTGSVNRFHSEVSSETSLNTGGGKSASSASSVDAGESDNAQELNNGLPGPAPEVAPEGPSGFAEGESKSVREERKELPGRKSATGGIRDVESAPLVHSDEIAGKNAAGSPSSTPGDDSRKSWDPKAHRRKVNEDSKSKGNFQDRGATGKESVDVDSLDADHPARIMIAMLENMNGKRQRLSQSQLERFDAKPMDKSGRVYRTINEEAKKNPALMRKYIEVQIPQAIENWSAKGNRPPRTAGQIIEKILMKPYMNYYGWSDFLKRNGEVPFNPISEAEKEAERKEWERRTLLMTGNLNAWSFQDQTPDYEDVDFDDEDDEDDEMGRQMLEAAQKGKNPLDEMMERKAEERRKRWRGES